MRTLLFVCMLSFTFSVWGQARRAQNLIEKEKFESAYLVLTNSIAKDSTIASTPFVLATLFLVEDWPQHNLDSAYHFVLSALYKYDKLGDKEIDKHIKDGYGKTRLLELKTEINHKAFRRAINGGKVEDYQRFIDNHSGANEIDSAIYLRNEQAFIIASDENTLISYKYFLDHYNNAKDWQEANARYQEILYNENTIYGKLKEYETFVKEHPKSPYYEQAVWEIFLIKGGGNTIETFLEFVDNYPQSAAKQKAIDYLYHKHLEHETASTFADKYPRIEISDSLQNVINIQSAALLPTWSGQFIQMTNLKGEVVTDSLTSIGPSWVSYDYFSAQKNKTDLLIGKNGLVFFDGTWKSALDLGSGFILLEQQNGNDIVHKNGLHVNTAEKALLVGPYIGYRINDKWGLKSITNKKITEPVYDSLWYSNGLIFLERNKEISPNKPAFFYPGLDKEKLKPGQFFTEVEWLTDSLLWVAHNDKEGLYNHNFVELVPLQKQRIDLTAKGWAVEHKGKILNSEFSALWLDGLKENNNWQIGEIGDSIMVKFNYQLSFAPDNALLLGPAAIEMQFGDSTFVYLNDSISFLKPSGCQVKPLLDQNNKAVFYEIAEGKNRHLMNSMGQKILPPKYNKIVPLSNKYYLLETAKGKTLYSSGGAPLLGDLDGVAQINDSTLSILRDQKFGLFNPTDSILIKPQYDKKLVPLVDSIWVVSIENKYGLISTNDLGVLPIEYDEVSYWTNGLVFVKKDLKWNLFDIKSNTFKITGVVQFTSITKGSTTMIKFQKGVGVGVYNSVMGIVLKPTYSSIHLEGTSEEPYFRADKYVEEASLHILLYYDISGKLLFKKIIDDEAFELIFGLL